MADAPDVPPARSAAWPPRRGNVVRPLVDGIPAFSRIAEAVEDARARVWATIAFLDRTAELPGGRGTLFDLLGRVASRGLDVRVVFWRAPELDPARPGWEHFPGNAEQRAWLAERGAGFRARWDRLPRACHHQKSWIVDAGEPDATAFVGGINLDRMSIVAPGHAGPPAEHYHDVYAEVGGPVVTDVERNFVQRWNEASERGADDGVWPDAAHAGDLPAPTRTAVARGDVTVQLGRTLPRGRYSAAPDGERSVLEQYAQAIDAARRAIYLENQFFASLPIFERLAAALRRGVEVVAVVPRSPLEEVRDSRRHPKHAPLFDALAALGRFERFTLAGLVATDAPGRRRDVYVHAKIAIVDDVWTTIGSANLDVASLDRSTELNATCWSGTVARGLRRALFREHLGDAHDPDDAGRACARFAERARDNAALLAIDSDPRGLAVAIDPATYGV
jgi:cardiolipin synthase